MTVEFILVEVPGILVPHVAQAPAVDGVIDPGEYDQALLLPIDPAAAGDVALYLAVSGSQLFFGIDARLDPEEEEWDRVRISFDKDLNGQWPAAPADEGIYVLAGWQGGTTIFIPGFNPGDGFQMDFQHMEMDPAGFTGAVGFTDNHRVYEMALDLELSHLDVGPAGAFGMYIMVETGQMGAGTRTGSWPPVVPETDDQMFFGLVDMYAEPARLSVSPVSFEVTAVEDDPDPALELTVENLGGLETTVQVAPSEDWLVPEDPAVFDLAPGGSRAVQVMVSLSGLAIGTHLADIQVDAPGAEDSPVHVPVQLEVTRANTAPPAPGLLSPSDGADVYGPVEFTASTVADPEGDTVSYHFHLLSSSADEVLDEGAGEVFSGFVTWSPSVPLAQGDTFRWRVQASDDRGAVSDFSETWSFTVIHEPGSGCGCAHESAPPVGLLVSLFGLVGLAFFVRRGSVM